MYTTAGLGTPTWTISTANLKALYDSSGDIVTARKSDFTDVRKRSLYEDVRTALTTLANDTYIFVDAVNGSDSTGTGAANNHYKTWNKAVTVLNTAGAGNLWFFNGTYEMDVDMSYLLSNVIFDAEELGQVILHCGSNLFPIRGTNGTINDIFFRMDIMSGGDDNRFFGTVGLTANNCLFLGQPGRTWIIRGDFTDMTLNHCTIIGYDKDSAGLRNGNDTTITLNDCIFYDLDKCVYSTQGTVNENYCGFYEYNTQNYGGATFNQSNNVFTDPVIADKDTAILDENSPYIDAASDGLDIGVWEDGGYNITRTATETITASEPSVVDAYQETVSDSILSSDTVEETTMNLNIDMFLGGLFTSSITGGITYRGAGYYDSYQTYNPSFEYEGAAMDISFDNPGGDMCKVYIAVDDGVSDYDSPLWWNENVQYEAGSTTDVSPYFININNETETDDEFGKLYTIRNATSGEGGSDGVNDQIAEIKVHVRIKNTVTNNWSELKTAERKYYFNDFAKTMYYAGDNPRVVNNEYANHANYYSQVHHSGTNKYTRPDSVDWAADGRRFSYNPMFKIERHVEYTSGTPTYGSVYGQWQERKTGTPPIGENSAKRRVMFYGCVSVNFGNWNYNGDSLFPDKTNQPYDKANTNIGNPVLGSGATDLHYIGLVGHQGSDCGVHSSHHSIITRFPSGENIGWGDWIGIHKKIDDSDIYFSWANDPWGCEIYSYYLWVEDDTETVPGGYEANKYITEIIYVNTDYNGGYEFGRAVERYHNVEDELIASW